MMHKLKVCLIGATGVGKTSLVARFLHSIFSDHYLTTVGVKVETIDVAHHDQLVKLVVWDLSGEDEFQSVNPAYVTGSAGFVLVVDGTRRHTVETALGLVARVRATAGDVPFVLMVNKVDLAAAWDVTPADLTTLRELAYAVVETSARTGQGVQRGFELLVDAMLARVEPRREAPWI